jgi:hypothetical protein
MKPPHLARVGAVIIGSGGVEVYARVRSLDQMPCLVVQD